MSSMAELLIDLLKSNKSVSASTVIVIVVVLAVSALANDKATKVLDEAKQANATVVKVEQKMKQVADNAKDAAADAEARAAIVDNR